jgi:hypothetical protein
VSELYPLLAARDDPRAVAFYADTYGWPDPSTIFVFQ